VGVANKYGGAVAVRKSVPSMNRPTTAAPLAVAMTWKPASTDAPSVGEVIFTSSVPGLGGGLAPDSRAALGVQKPVGPSQPVVALHRMLPHGPLLPMVTSNSEPVLCAICAAVMSPRPIDANSAATSGDAALVPPTTTQPPARVLYTASPVAGSPTAAMSLAARNMQVDAV